MLGGCIALPLLLAPALCISGDEDAQAQILNTMIFVSGMVTALQTSLGTRYILITMQVWLNFNVLYCILSINLVSGPHGHYGCRTIPRMAPHWLNVRWENILHQPLSLGNLGPVTFVTKPMTFDVVSQLLDVGSVNREMWRRSIHAVLRGTQACSHPELW